MTETTREYAWALFNWLQVGDVFLIPYVVPDEWLNAVHGGYTKVRVVDTFAVCGLPAQVTVVNDADDSNRCKMKGMDIEAINAVAAEPDRPLIEREPWRKLRPGLCMIRPTVQVDHRVEIFHEASGHPIPNGWEKFEFAG